MNNFIRIVNSRLAVVFTKISPITSPKVLIFRQFSKTSIIMSQPNGVTDVAGEQNKRVCKRIGTHNGKFHCDEALACFLLKQLPEYKDSQITRSRDPVELEKCDIVVDVGGVYDPQTNRFDHHQKTFTHTFSTINPSKPWTIKLSSAGLVYVHFGQSVIEHMLTTKFNLNFENKTELDRLVEIIYDKVYEEFIREIDAIDNGVNIADERRYEITTNLSSRVSFLNPNWNDKVSNENDQFYKAMELVGQEFSDRIHYYAAIWWPGRSIVEQAIKKRFEIDPSGAIVTIESVVPWKSHLFAIEKELSIENSIKYVLFADNSSNWRIQCVPVSEHSFTNRLSILDEWKGLRDQELSEKAQIQDCIFVHAGGFIGGAKTYEGVLQMAKKCIQ